MAGLLARWFGLETKSFGSELDYLRYLGIGSTSKAGQVVNWQNALEVSTVLACAKVKAEGLAQVPCRVVKYDERGRVSVVRSHPLHDLLYRQPNAFQTSFEFREQIGLHLAITGNAYIFKVVSDSGELLELLPYPPNCVSVERLLDGTVIYRVTLADGRQVTVGADRMWHIRGISWDGWRGLDALKLAQNAVGLAMATEAYGSELFANAARPSGILTTEQAPNKEALESMKAQWQAANSGAGGRHGTAVLSAGIKWQALSNTAEDSQFIETRKQQVMEICRFMRVLPIMVMQADGTQSYASVEQMLLAHDTHTLAPDRERFEQSAETHLLTARERAEGYEIELDAREITRGSLKDRAEAGAILKQNGSINGQEHREMAGFPMGDDPVLDEFHAAANLYGDAPATSASEA